MRYVGARGELELLAEGTVEREAAEAGERIYQLSDLDELLAELRMDREKRHFRAKLEETPANQGQGEAREVDMVGVEEVGAMLIARALERANA